MFPETTRCRHTDSTSYTLGAIIGLSMAACFWLLRFLFVTVPRWIIRAWRAWRARHHARQNAHAQVLDPDHPARVWR